jgi:hypothetical protein
MQVQLPVIQLTPAQVNEMAAAYKFKGVSVILDEPAKATEGSQASWNAGNRCERTKPD